MTQQIPPPPKSSNKNGRIVAALLIGLVVGLGIGVVIGDVALSTHNGAGTNNQVQVSGTVTGNETNTIYFISLNQTIETSAPIVNGKYSVLLVGGQSYDICDYSPVIGERVYSTYNQFYVPLGITTLTENLVPSS